MLYPNNSPRLQYFPVFFSLHQIYIILRLNYDVDDVKIFNDTVKVLIYQSHVQIYTECAIAGGTLGIVFMIATAFDCGRSRSSRLWIVVIRRPERCSSERLTRTSSYFGSPISSFHSQSTRMHNVNELYGIPSFIYYRPSTVLVY